MNEVSEEFVTKTVISYLRENNWILLDYDFPGGGSGRSFKTTETKGKNKGTVIIDIIAVKEEVLLCLESKRIDTLSDYKKIQNLSQNSVFINNVKKTYGDRHSISRVLFGICFSGQWKRKSSMSEYPNVGIVFSIINRTILLVHNKSPLIFRP